MHKKGAKCQKAPMEAVKSSYPLDLVSIDFLSIERNNKKYNILVMIDVFTKYGKAVITPDQTAKTVARVLWRDFFMVYGFCRTIISDQGKCFEADIIKELCLLAGVKKTRTTSYKPSGNVVERWNRTLLNMLRSIEDNKRFNFNKILPEVVHAYNSRIHESTGFSPYYLFFGRNPRLPIDSAFGIKLGPKHVTTSHYVKELRKSLTLAYERATKSMQQSHNKNKVRYDLTAHAAKLHKGDRVLVRKLGPRVESKICDRWENDIYIVIATHGELPVYTVVDESRKNPERTLHRNYLFPVGQIDESVEENNLHEVDEEEVNDRRIEENNLHEVDDEEVDEQKEIVVHDNECNDNDAEESSDIFRIALFPSNNYVNTEVDDTINDENNDVINDDVVHEEIVNDRELPRRSTRIRRPVDRLCYSRICDFIIPWYYNNENMHANYWPNVGRLDYNSHFYPDVA